MSALDVPGLRRIAEITGGTYRDAAAGPAPLVDLYRRNVLPMARRAFEKDRRREPENRYQWPLLAAFLVWILELGRSERKRDESAEGRTAGRAVGAPR